jgi:hypothetical protein
VRDVAHDLPAVVDPAGDRGPGAGHRDRRPPRPPHQEAPRRAPGIHVDAHDLAAVVDVDRGGGGGAHQLERGVPAVTPDEPVAGTGVVDVGPHDVALVVDARRQGGRRPGEVEAGDLVTLADEAPRLGAHLDERRVLAVAAHDLALVVDLDRLGPLGPRHVERPDRAARVPHEPGLAVGPPVLAHDLAPVVDAAGEDRDVRARRVEVGGGAVVAHERRDGRHRGRGLGRAGRHGPGAPDQPGDGGQRAYSRQPPPARASAAEPRHGIPSGRRRLLGDWFGASPPRDVAAGQAEARHRRATFGCV